MNVSVQREAAPARLRVLTLLVPAAGLVAMGAAVLADPRPPALGLVAVGIALGGAMLAADLRPIRIGPSQKTSLAAVPALTAALLVPPPVAVAVAGAAALASNLMLGRRPRNAAYNAGMVALAAAAAALMGGLSGETGPIAMARAVAGAVAFSVITIALSAAASAAQRERPFAPAIGAAIEDSWPQAAAMSAVAIACAILLLRAPWAAVLPLALLPLVYRLNRLIEAELESKDRLERMLRSQRRFLTDVSHNVGNPLATIRTNLSLLGRARLEDAQRVAVADAATESARLSELFRRLRVLAETDDDLPIRPVDVALDGLAADLIRAYRGPADAQSVRLDRVVEAPTMVSADEDLLRQAAANLLENAIRHSPAGGLVTIRVARHDRTAAFEVVDQGPGIDPAELDRIFERFERGPGGGSGLGLAIARSVVERHGGRITVDTAPGAGARFSILLPAAAR